MDLMCLKCNEKFAELDNTNVYATTCGHLFHNQCLVQWLERFGTCPHCKLKQSIEDIFKIYFCLPDVPQKNLQELKNKHIYLNSELKLKESDLKSLKTEIASLKINKKELRQELKKLKKEVEVKNGAIQFNRMAVDYHTRICKIKEKYEIEAVRLKQRLNTLQGISEILNGQDSDVDDILLRSTLDKAGLTLCVDTLAESLRESNQFSEKLDNDLVCYQNELIQMEDELESLKAEQSNLLQDLLDEEECSGELTDIRRNIYTLIQNRCIGNLLNVFPELENSSQSEITEGETAPETSTKPTSLITEIESAPPEIVEKENHLPAFDLALQKKCKALVKTACKNPMQYLTSGKVELLDSDEDSENVSVKRTKKQMSKINGSSNSYSESSGNVKYKKLVKKKNLSAEAGAVIKKQTPSQATEKAYYSVLDLMASNKK